MVSVFSIAMGFMESSVVIYLRKIYYPEGFVFPLVSISSTIRATELLREAATIVMLVAIAWLAGKNHRMRFAYFLLAFACWDLVYYLFLKLILNWPSSLLDWDILFLLPVPWVGPVLAPCILSVCMLVLSFLIIRNETNGSPVLLNTVPLLFLILGSLVIIFSFTQCYVYIMDNHTNLLLNKGFIPQHFNWTVFGLGLIFIFCGMLQLWKNSPTPSSSLPL